jgi:hypothetical protein
MQATVGANRLQVRSGRFGLILVVGLTVSLVLGLLTLAVSDLLPSTSASTTVRSMPKAYANAGQGEGLLRRDATPGTVALTAHTSAGQGEGLVGAHLALASATLQAHASLGQGEGIVGGIVTLAQVRGPLKAYASAGMGEGWLALGRPATARTTSAYDTTRS